MPGAKPSEAAVLARTAVAEAGSSRISGEPRRRSRTPHAAPSRPAVQAAAISRAIGLVRRQPGRRGGAFPRSIVLGRLRRRASPGLNIIPPKPP